LFNEERKNPERNKYCASFGSDNEAYSDKSEEDGDKFVGDTAWVVGIDQAWSNDPN